MFKTYVHSLIQLQARMLGEKQFKNAAYLTIAPTILAGLPSSFAFALGKVLAGFVPGLDSPDELEEDFYKWVGEIGGEYSERLARSGTVSLFGLDMRGSLAPGEPTFPTTLRDIGGAPYSAGSDIVRGVGNLSVGEFGLAAENILPKFIGNLFKSEREFSEGVSTRAGAPVFYEDERLKANHFESLIRMAGFNPISLSEKREKQWTEKKIGKRYSELRGEIYDGVRRFLKRGGKQSEWMGHLNEIMEYNARVKRNGYSYIPLITPTQLKALKTRFENPGKRERLRATGDVREDRDNDIENFSFE